MNQKSSLVEMFNLLCKPDAVRDANMLASLGITSIKFDFISMSYVVDWSGGSLSGTINVLRDSDDDLPGKYLKPLEDLGQDSAERWMRSAWRCAVTNVLLKARNVSDLLKKHEVKAEEAA